MRLPLRYYAATLIIALAPLAICSTTLVRLTANEIKGRAIKSLMDLAESDEGNIFGFIDKYETHTRDLASDFELKRLLALALAPQPTLPPAQEPASDLAASSTQPQAPAAQAIPTPIATVPNTTPAPIPVAAASSASSPTANTTGVTAPIPTPLADAASPDAPKELDAKPAPPPLPEPIAKLANYLSDDMLRRDSGTYSIKLIMPDGTVLASSTVGEIGKTASADILKLLKTSMEGVKSTDLPFDFEGNQYAVLHFFTPLLTTDEKGHKVPLAYLVTRVNGKELVATISGEHQMRMGALPGTSLMRGATSETVIVSRATDTVLMSSRFVDVETGKDISASLPVTTCVKDGLEYSGAWNDYRKTDVYGATACPRNAFWMLMTKIDASEIEEGVSALTHILQTLAGGFAILVIILLAYIHKKLDEKFVAECTLAQSVTPSSPPKP